MRGHEHEHDQPLDTHVFHRVFFPGASMRGHTGRQLMLVRTDLHECVSLDDVIDFIGTLVFVRRLFLPRFEAVDVAKHPIGFKEVDLLETFR